MLAAILDLRSHDPLSLAEMTGSYVIIVSKDIDIVSVTYVTLGTLSSYF